MKDKSKKEIILIILLIIVVCFVIFLTIIKVKNKNTIENNSFESKLETTIKEINEINKIFETINLEDANKYKQEESDMYCYKYNGNDTQDYIKRINNLYENPFYEFGNFDIISIGVDENNEENNLYLCISENCKVSQIENYKILIDEEDRKVINIENSEYVMKKIDNNWKFTFPILICE